MMMMTPSDKGGQHTSMRFIQLIKEKCFSDLPRVQALKIQGPPLGGLGCLLGDALPRQATTGAEGHFWRKRDALSAGQGRKKKPFTSSVPG